MNRLTVRYSGIHVGYKSKHNNSVLCSEMTVPQIRECMEKLAAYEDTGLEPEEIKEHEEIFKAYRHVCGGRPPEEIKKALELLDLEEQLIDKYNELKNKIDGDGVENYTNGYKYGHRNGQIELLEWILKIDTGYREEAEKALEVENE